MIEQEVPKYLEEDRDEDYFHNRVSHRELTGWQQKSVANLTHPTPCLSAIFYLSTDQSIDPQNQLQRK